MSYDPRIRFDLGHLGVAAGTGFASGIIVRSIGLRRTASTLWRAGRGGLISAAKAGRFATRATEFAVRVAGRGVALAGRAAGSRAGSKVLVGIGKAAGALATFDFIVRQGSRKVFGDERIFVIPTNRRELATTRDNIRSAGRDIDRFILTPLGQILSGEDPTARRGRLRSTVRMGSLIGLDAPPNTFDVPDVPVSPVAQRILAMGVTGPTIVNPPSGGSIMVAAPDPAPAPRPENLREQRRRESEELRERLARQSRERRERLGLPPR